ncbi:uncharacterized protein BX663DRAFT_542124 [Cokeromyces recurvatus]|uniref:uncharacterized protein n=1 Tax=Cokeromyces recurvatus TaxID=90255 RepID=UPI0022207FD8|nr:uncharacterized protein BX663DRAFT_542124 [Cokeromyces recurvatus]KAI7904480.1 hypothetical protein BX663DRAFT_542124 [Cokeromyces recurvatus]
MDNTQTSSSIRSRLSATKTELHNNMPDFTEFKLEAFKMNSSSSPKVVTRLLRENRRSFVFYLEPNPGTGIHTSLQRYQDTILHQFGPNQAHNTRPHISIFNRILIEDSHLQHEWNTIVEELIQILDQEIKRRHLQLTSPEFNGFEILNKPSHSLVINVKLNHHYITLANQVKDQIGLKRKQQHQQQILLETGPMDTIHLAYNILQSIPRQDLKEMKEKAEKMIDLYDWFKTGGSWRLVLYEVMLESQVVVGVQHQLNEIKSWPLKNNHTTTASTATATATSTATMMSFRLLPVSLRIKLSFLSSWFKDSIIPFSSTTKIFATPPPLQQQQQQQQQPPSHSVHLLHNNDHSSRHNKRAATLNK